MTTIVLVRKNNEVVVAGDGQVSMGNTVVKSTASKVRKIEKRDVVAGFAGSTADALTLFERLEAKIEKHAGNLSRALDKFPACFSIFASSLSNKVRASAVDPANPATTSLFSIFLTFEAVLFTTVFPILTCPSPATTTSLFFLTSTIVVIINKW